MEFYTYWRSSAAFRVRIALNLKRVDYTPEFIDLSKPINSLERSNYSELSRTNLIPSIKLDNGAVISESIAIIDYLEEAYPQHPLLPSNLVEKAKVKAFASMIACNIHPLHGQRVVTYLSDDQKSRDDWSKHWIEEGLSMLEKILSAEPESDFCFGNKITIADIFLIPQLQSARRFNIDINSFPQLSRVEAHCLSLDCFIASLPKNQPDAQT